MLTTLKKSFFLGIDGGGTKTEVVISSESGFILGRGHSGGANPHNIPLNEAFAHIQEAIQQALDVVRQQHPDVQIQNFEAACMGMAGIDTDDDRKHVSDYINSLSEKDRTFNAKRFILVNDGLTGFKSGTDANWGVCLIASTGSNCYGISSSGKEAAAGDWGYILGDLGSSFAIGQSILRQVMKEYDGRSPRTTISNKVLKFLKLESVHELVKWVYRDKVPVRDIASLSQLCDDVGLTDSMEISQVLNQTVAEAMNAYRAVIGRLNVDTQASFPVVLIGGLFSMRGRFADMIIRSVLNTTPQASVIFPTRIPAEGAIRIALMAAINGKLLPNSAVTFINPHVE